MVSVVVPALNESVRIGAVVRLALRSPLTGEVIVVDDGSIDDTVENARSAGARVITSSLLGKGASMRDGLESAAHPVILYLDGDLAGLSDDLVERMCAPVLDGSADFVKAKFRREAGRVTALTARPLLSTFFPEVMRFEQPLGGIMAARRDLLFRLKFETDYGADVGLFLDACMNGARMREVDIGRLEHDSQSLTALSDMAKQVVRTVLDRAHRYGRFHIDQVREVEEVERQAAAELSVTMESLASSPGVALFDMDGTLTKGRFVLELAERTGRSRRLHEWLDRADLDDEARARAIAAVFRGVPRGSFEDAARALEPKTGAVETIIALRRAGYRAGIVSDSYWIASEIVRRRVFADFSVAHILRFHDGLCTGEVRPSPLFARGPGGCPDHAHCKRNVAMHIAGRLGTTGPMVVVGDNVNDICMLRCAARSFAVDPKDPAVAAAAAHVIESDLRRILPLLGLTPKRLATISVNVRAADSAHARAAS